MASRASKSGSSGQRGNRRTLPTNTTKNKEPKSKGGLNKARCDQIIADCLRELSDLPINPETGKIFRGSAKAVIDDYLAINAWLTEDVIKSKRKRQKAAAEEAAKVLNDSNRLDGASNQTRLAEAPSLEDLKPAALPGRKKGSTIAAISESKRKFTEVKNNIVKGWVDKSKRPKNTTLSEWIKQNLEDSGFNTGKPEHQITTSMVKSRMKRGQIESEGNKGQVSPLARIEPRLVMFIKLASDCNHDMTQDEILDFVNSYIEGSDLEQEVIKWKVRNNAEWRNSFLLTKTLPKRASIGAGWFRGLLRRWKDEISYSKSKNTAHYRKEHCTYSNFSLMYDRVYNLLEEGAYAKKLPHPVLFDQAGEQCDDHPENAFAKPVDLHFTRPELVFCADECGTNTNMSNDRLSGGNKRVHTKGTNPTLPGCTSDTHFTTMGFTSLDGRPVCCVVIIQKEKKLTIAERYGFDVDAKWNGDLSIFDKMRTSLENAEKDTEEDDGTGRRKKKRKKKQGEQLDIPVDLLRLNMGPGRAFPGGPVCNFNGKRIPPFVTNSESGGITPEILVSILEHLDKHGVTDRKEGDPPPCLIVDGHSSRLSIPFLRYINNLNKDGETVPGANHRWKVFIGLPNGTAYWQVADSSYINGRFKLQMRREKEAVRKDQRHFKEAIQIKRHHVVLMMRNCWATSFGDVKGNKKAILERGWNPLNRGCLVMPDILKTRRKDPPKAIATTETSATSASWKEPSYWDGEWHCAAEDQCGLGNTPFTDKDTHRCKTCGRKVHGVLCCVEQREEEEGTGLFFCKKCGRPGENKGRSDAQKSRSQLLEEKYSKDPDHCKTCNPSGDGCYPLIKKLQDSDKRDVAREKRIDAIHQRGREERAENRFYGLVTGRLTAGTLAGAGEHDVSDKDFLVAMEKKLEQKKASEMVRLEKKYRRQLKIYQDGLKAMNKARLQETILATISREPERETELVKEARKEKKWLLANDYLDLIKFKRLGLPKELQEEIPTTLLDRKNAWFVKYKGLPDPDEPTMPHEVEVATTTIADDGEEEDDDAFFDNVVGGPVAL